MIYFHFKIFALTLILQTYNIYTEINCCYRKNGKHTTLKTFQNVQLIGIVISSTKHNRKPKSGLKTLLTANIETLQ